jgi:hypothetical protein
MGEVISRQNGGTSSHDCMGSNASKNVREQDPRPSPIPLPSTTTVPAGLQFSLEKDAVYKENVVYGKLKFKIKGLGSWLGPGHVKNVSQCPQGQRVIWPPPHPCSSRMAEFPTQEQVASRLAEEGARHQGCWRQGSRPACQAPDPEFKLQYCPKTTKTQNPKI